MMQRVSNTQIEWLLGNDSRAQPEWPRLAVEDLRDARLEVERLNAKLAFLACDRDAAMVRAARAEDGRDAATERAIKAEWECVERPRLADAQGATIDALVRRAETAERERDALSLTVDNAVACLRDAERDRDLARERANELGAMADDLTEQIAGMRQRADRATDGAHACARKAVDLAAERDVAREERDRACHDASAHRQMVADLRRDLEQRDIVVAAFAVVLREIARGAP